MEHKLEFLNPVFRPGRNISVRDGKKWAINANPGESARLTKAETGEVVATGTIISLTVTFMGLIRRSELAHEHDPDCREMDGLYAAMKLAYDKDFNADSIVTVIEFWVWYDLEQGSRADKAPA